MKNAAPRPGKGARSALAGLEAALHLVDHIDPALAADQAVVTVAAAQRFQRVTDFHGTSWKASEGRARQAGKQRNRVLSSWRRCRPERAVSRPWEGRMSMRTGRFHSRRRPKKLAFRQNTSGF